MCSPMYLRFQGVASILGLSGSAWEPFGAGLAYLGSFSWLLEAILGLSWPILGLSWAILGALGGHLGPSNPRVKK